MHLHANCGIYVQERKKKLYDYHTVMWRSTNENVCLVIKREKKKRYRRQYQIERRERAEATSQQIFELLEIYTHSHTFIS